MRITIRGDFARCTATLTLQSVFIFHLLKPMCQTTARDSLGLTLSALEADRNGATRLLAIYSAAIALADDMLLERAIGRAAHLALTREHLYEVVLQSYLFLGFPRMLSAAESLDQHMPGNPPNIDLGPISSHESREWWERGTALCKQIYGEKYDLLRQKVAAMAPEIFRWMLIEGYGKVLSRGLLSILEREISIVAFLAVENRPKQLRSHILGAMNVGASPELIRQIVKDLRPVAPESYEQAHLVLAKLKSS